MNVSTWYFGYGGHADIRIIEAILGRSPLGTRARIQGHPLCVQQLPHIPAAARAVLEKNWPSTFRSYGMLPKSKAVRGAVNGMAWQMTEVEVSLMREWNLVELGWFEQFSTTAYIRDSSTRIVVHTEILPRNAHYETLLDLRRATTQLNGLELTLGNARRFREAMLSTA